jgi:hypothetical protein
MGKESNAKVVMNVPYFQTPNDIFDLRIKVRDGIKIREIRTSEKLVYIYLCRCANNTGEAFPSYATIAEKCSISKRKAIDSVRVLTDSGLLIKYVRRKDNKDNHTNIYEVISPSATIALGSETVALGSATIAPNKELHKKEPYKKNQGIYKGVSPDGVTLAVTFPQYLDRFGVDNEEMTEAIHYYLEQYEQYRGKPHPRLKPEQWERVLLSLISANGEFDNYIELMPEDLIPMIDKHFETKYADCDYNILHFISEGVKKNRFYEVAY